MFKIDCQKCFTKLKRMKNSQSKTDKNGKEHGTAYCLGCKDFTHNFRPQEVKMTNKVLREKCCFEKKERCCFVCRSNKSRF